MAKQLLIYDEAKPVTDRHREWSVRAGTDYLFAKEINSVPLTAVEFGPAAVDYPIVFAGNDEQIMPLAVMGMRADQNLFIADDGAVTASYVPAFLRRYPFVFSSADEGSNFTLCIDESFAGCNQENRGERLFDADGERTQYLNSVLEFLKEYQSQFTRTDAFCKTLVELGLLESMGAQMVPAGGEKITLTGFQAVNRQKLKALSGDAVDTLFKNDGLELIYLHLQSMRNFARMLEKVGAADGVKANGEAPDDALAVDQ